MKTKLILVLLFTFLFFSTTKAQDVKNDSVKSEIVVKNDTVKADTLNSTITLPTFPTSSSALPIILWIVGAAVATDVIGRIIPTKEKGKYAWITKVIEILYKVLLYLDNQKKVK